MAYNNAYGYSSNGYLQYLDQNGKPLTGGTLSTFIAGTTTPIVTYKDFNGEQNPAVIPLDENGGATVILRQDIVYKFIIRDKNGDIFKTIDNIVTAGNTTVVEGDDVKISGKEGEIVVDYFIDTKEYSIKLDNTILAKLDEKEVFFCRYNNTSYSEIRDAYSAKKLIIMYKSQYNLYEYFLLDARDPHAFRFKKVEKDRITFYTIDNENGWLESYQNYEVDAQLPIASESVLGGIKVGQNLSIDEDGTLNAQAGGGGTSDNDKDIFVLPYETATYAQIKGYAQSGKQVVIHYAGVDDDQFWTLSHKNDEFSYVFTWLNGNSLVKMTLSSGNEWTEEVIDLKAIKDNAYDSDDNITEVQELTFFRNQGTGANYPILSSEERTYGVLLPAPSLQADHGKVPMYKVGDKIEWETVPSPDSVSAEIADAVATVKTNNIFTIQLGAIQKVITPTGSGTLYSYWTIISPSMDFPLSEKTTLSFLIKQLGACTKAYLAIYEIDIYNQKKKWVANTNDFHASLALGYNYVNLAYINSSARLSSDKFYYVCLISNINSFQFAGNSYDTQFNGVPRLANKINNINAEFNAATMQTVYAEFGLTEGSEILDRLFFNISNVERIIDPVAPTPFLALTNITLGHTKNVGNLVPAATTFGANGILYQKLIPQMDITIKSVWVLDYHSSQNAALLSLFILDEDLNSLTSVNVPTLTNAGTSEKIGNYYVHKYAFSTPITLQEGKGYWMPAIGNCSNGTSEWAIQYTAADPSIPIRDMLAVSDITNFAIADKVIANNKNGCYLKLIDITDTEWQI